MRGFTLLPAFMKTHCSSQTPGDTAGQYLSHLANLKKSYSLYISTLTHGEEEAPQH